jgi:hypothetical protein
VQKNILTQSITAFPAFEAVKTAENTYSNRNTRLKSGVAEKGDYQHEQFLLNSIHRSASHNENRCKFPAIFAFYPHRAKLSL